MPDMNPWTNLIAKTNLESIRIRKGIKIVQSECTPRPPTIPNFPPYRSEKYPAAMGVSKWP